MSLPSAGGYHLGPGEGEPTWFLDTLMTVKAGTEQTGGAFTLLEWSAPRGFGPPLHVHHREDEVFYILDGSMDVVCGEQRWAAESGSLVLLPRRVPHAFIVISNEPIRGLQITAPAGFERYIAELGRPPERPGLPQPTEPDLTRISAISTRYGYEIVGPPMFLPA